MHDHHKRIRHDAQAKSIYRARYLNERYGQHEGPNEFRDRGHAYAKPKADEAVAEYRKAYAEKHLQP